MKKEIKRNGFTLIELLVVVLIIGILSAVALPKYQKAVEKSRLSEVRIMAKALRQAYQVCVLEEGNPSACQYENFQEKIMKNNLPGQTSSNCYGGVETCFKTSNWEYQNGDTSSTFYAYRKIGNSIAYYFEIFYTDGDSMCYPEDDMDACDKICGGYECSLD